DLLESLRGGADVGPLALTGRFAGAGEGAELVAQFLEPLPRLRGDAEDGCLGEPVGAGEGGEGIQNTLALPLAEAVDLVEHEEGDRVVPGEAAHELLVQDGVGVL